MTFQNLKVCKPDFIIESDFIGNLISKGFYNISFQIYTLSSVCVSFK